MSDDRVIGFNTTVFLKDAKAVDDFAQWYKKEILKIDWVNKNQQTVDYIVSEWTILFSNKSFSINFLNVGVSLNSSSKNFK